MSEEKFLVILFAIAASMMLTGLVIMLAVMVYVMGVL
jgi:hypothetical protein